MDVRGGTIEQVVPRSAPPRSQQLLFALIVLAMSFSIWGALYPENTWLQVGPVAVALPFAWAALRRYPLSTPAVACLASFLLLHLLAARWSYSFVPYDEWFGLDPRGRNNFDRGVHLLFGVLFTLPLAEVLVRYGRLTVRAALLVTFLAVQAISAIYEMFEYGLALTMSPESVEAYNGQQGDIFDAQKDMFLAFAGNLLALPVAGLLLRRTDRD